MVPYTKDIGLQVFRHNLRHDVHACERVFFLVLLILCTEVMDRKLVVTGRADRIIPNLWTASWLRSIRGVIDLFSGPLNASGLEPGSTPANKGDFIELETLE